MGKHTKGDRHHSGSLQELATAMIAHLGGLPSDEELAAPAPKPPVDEWVTPDEWARQHSGKAVR
jgi:hypothetical protein